MGRDAHPSQAQPPASHGASGHPRGPHPQSGIPQDALPRVIPIEQLLGQDDEVFLLCGGQLYRLRRTRQGKLVLHK